MNAKAKKQRCQKSLYAGSIFLFLISLCVLNVFVLESKTNLGLLAKDREKNPLSGDMRKRQLASVQQSNSASASLPVLRDLQSLHAKEVPRTSNSSSAVVGTNPPAQNASALAPTGLELALANLSLSHFRQEIRTDATPASVSSARDTPLHLAKDLAADGQAATSHELKPPVYISNAKVDNVPAADPHPAGTMDSHTPTTPQSEKESLAVPSQGAAMYGNPVIVSDSSNFTKEIQPTKEQTKSVQLTQSTVNATQPGLVAGVTANPQRDVALAVAQNVDEANMAVFVASLRRYSSCTIVVMVVTVSPQAYRLFERYGVKIRQYRLDQYSQKEVKSFNPRTQRWFLYQQFVEEEGDKYDRILIADIADTAFQSNPFNIITSPGIYFGSENDKWRSRGRMGGLIAACYGKTIAVDTEERHMTVNGVLLGTMGSVVQYLQLVTSEMLTPAFIGCEKKGADQVVHHVVEYRDEIQDLHLLSQYDGQIAHLEARRAKVNITVFNNRSEEMAIVHQYDSNAKLMQRLYARWVDADVHEEKKGKGRCNSYMVKTNIVAFPKHNLLMLEPQRVHGIDECCTACTKRRSEGCFGVVYDADKNTCSLKGVGQPNRHGEVLPMVSSAWLISQDSAVV